MPVKRPGPALLGDFTHHQDQTESRRFGEDSRGAAAYDLAMKSNRAMTPMLSPARIAAQNAEHPLTGPAGTARRFGFSPAFLDWATMRIHPARFADGTLAPYHCLDGLPDEVVLHRLRGGRVLLAKATLISGFERGGFFYTRTATVRACEQWVAPSLGSGERRPPAAC